MMPQKNWLNVPLGEVIKIRKEFIAIDDLTVYKRCRVQLHAQGIVLRDTVSGSEIKTKKQQVCNAGDFLVAEIDAKVGGFGLIPKNLDGSIVSSHYFIFTLDENHLNSQFLDYFLRTRYFQDQVAAQGSTNYAAIRPEDVLGYKIPLPPLDEQRRIVARIEELAAQIEEAREMRRQAIEETDIYLKQSVEMSFDSTHEISMTLDDVCEKIIDNLHSTPKYQGCDFPCIRSQDVGWGTINYSTALRTSYDEFLERTRRGEPRTGDIVYVREGDVGRCAVVDGSQRFSLGQRVMMFRPNNKKVDSIYLMLQLMSKSVLNDQVLSGMKGTTSHHVNIKHIRNIKIIVPSLAKQRSIVAHLDKLQSKLDLLKRHQAETAAALDALLPAVLERAFRDEL